MVLTLGGERLRRFMNLVRMKINPLNASRDFDDVNEEFGESIGTNANDDEDKNDGSGGGDESDNDDVDDVGHDLDEDFENGDDLF
ncbi:hypothetical protein F0562_012114 [Nyssa sinensis]|uniref:Uncharacterized protein n=1 Tax=Nyssa sinensis TaxID=561372 RepID=A0A5J4ZRH0_9ASTE|nr:hypothetical protein F0562_012114 [Nyssa sinensis]